MTGQPRALIIADDLTGAMDSAGPFAARGVETWVVAMPLRCDPESLKAARVVSVNTDSRHLSAADATARINEIVRRLGTENFDIIVKKIDSTLRGNVVAETLALLAASGRRAAVVAPAFPAQGRTVRDGVVYIEGKALAHTAFARDALSPPPLVPLQEAFAAAKPGLNIAKFVPSRRLDESIHIWLADSENDADLEKVVKTFEPRMGRVLMVGSAGLTKALASGCFDTASAPAAPPHVAAPIVFAVGSRAPRSAEQVEALASEPNTQIVYAPGGRPPSTPLETALNVVLKATANGAAEETDPHVVAGHIAKHAIEFVHKTGAQVLVATGGDTAIAILAASENPALQVLGDLMPGIPYARIRLAGEPVWLITKAGGFGGREAFRDLARRLRNG